MNKVAAVVLAAAMVGSMAVPAFAADTDSNYTQTSGETVTAENSTRSRSTTVNYTVTANYTWTIHSEITFDASNGSASTAVTKTGAVNVTKNVIPEGTQLQITVAGNGTADNGKAFTMKNTATGKNKELTYTVKSSAISSGNTELATGAVVLTVPAATNIGEATMTFGMTTDAVETAGVYQGTVTYTASIVEDSNG